MRVSRGRSWGSGRRGVRGGVGVGGTWKARVGTWAGFRKRAGRFTGSAEGGERPSSAASPGLRALPLPCRGSQGDPKHAGGRPRVSRCPACRGGPRGPGELWASGASSGVPRTVTAPTLPTRSCGDWRSQRVAVGYSLSNGGGRGSGRCCRLGGDGGRRRPHPRSPGLVPALARAPTCRKASVSGLTLCCSCLSVSRSGVNGMRVQPAH